MKKALTLLWIIVSIISSVSFAQVTITRIGSHPYSSIQDAITAAVNGDIINVAAGTYNENVSISKSITLITSTGATISAASPATAAITISANDVNVIGFNITNPGGNLGIYAADRSGITITNCNISNVGPTNAVSGTSNSGIAIISSAALVNNIYITNNTINNIQGGNYTSANGIAIGWTTGTFDITSLIISENTISNISSNTTAFPVGRGAYGILINHASGKDGNTGKTVGAQINNNTIYNLDGLWATGIGLEGNTPNAVVTGNVLHHITHHKGALDIDGQAIKFEDNASAATVTLSSNSFANVELGVRNMTAFAVNAGKNWWGDNNPSDNIRNAAGSITYTPWLTISTDANSTAPGFQGDLSQVMLNNTGTIASAISAVNVGGTVNLTAGTYNENVDLNKSVTITGAGETTILTPTVLNAVPGVSISAANAKLKNITVTSFSTGVAVSADGVELDYVNSIFNSSKGLELSAGTGNFTITNSKLNNNQIGFRKGTAPDISGFTMNNCEVKNNTAQGCFIAAENGANLFDNVTITNSDFSGNLQKGMYFEVLSNATISNILMNNSGTDASYGFNTGIDINLKYGNYINIVIRNSEITNCGAVGTATALDNPVAIAIKARNDGSYSGNPATLSNVTIENNIISGPRNGLRFGESNVFTNVGPTNVVVSENHFGAAFANKALINNTTAQTSALTNWWGSNVAATVAAKISGIVDYSQWLSIGTDTAPATRGFQPDNSQIQVAPGGSLDDAIDAVAEGGTLEILPGTYASFTIDKEGVTLNGNGAVITNASPGILINVDNITIENLVFNFNDNTIPYEDYAIDIQNNATNVIIRDCLFQTQLNGALGNGIINRGTGIVDARQNYWNSTTGPTSTINLIGTGTRANNTDGGQLLFYPWYINSSLTTLVSFPILTAPANLSTGVTITPELEWNWPLSATTFTVEIATNNTFTQNLFSSTTLNGGTDKFLQILDADALENGTIYYWKVTAAGTPETGGVAFTSSGSFTTIIPAKPLLVSPAHLTSIVGNIISFQWTAPMAGIKYVLEVNSDNNFSTGTMVAGFPTAAQTLNYYNFPFTGLSGTYYWRVKTYTVETTPKLISISSVFKFTVPGTPTAIPIYPTNLATMYTNSPTIWWLSNNNYYNSAVYYRVRYDNASHTNSVWTTRNGGGTLPYNPSAPTTNNYISLPNLTTGQTYYYVVDASTSNSFSAGVTTTSIEQSFVIYYSTVTLNAIPVYQSYPIAGTTVYTTTPTLYWYLGLQIPNITYNIELKDVTAGGGSLTNTATQISANELLITPALTAGHTYTWSVRINGSTWFGPETFKVHSSATAVTTTADAAVPTLASPVGGIVVSSQSPTLSWSAYSTKALEYKVTWSSDASFSPSNSSGWLVTNSYSLSALTPGVTYYWKVISRLADGTGSPSTPSSVGQFTVSPGASPVVVLPANPIVGSAINSTAASLSWVVPAQSTSTLTYELEISKNKDLSGATLISNLKEASYKADNLSSNANYYWRVRSKNESGAYSNYSYKGHFNTGSATAVEDNELPTQFSLDQNYPNPFNPITVISYSIVKSSFVSLKVYDILGREVKNLVNQEMSAGKYNLNWNGDDNFGNKVASGTYIYRITADNFVSSKKMILIK